MPHVSHPLSVADPVAERIEDALRQTYGDGLRDWSREEMVGAIRRLLDRGVIETP